MSGGFSLSNVEAAARAGAMQAGTLVRVEDDWAPDPQMTLSLEDLQRQMDEAGHEVGGGYDDCAVCQRMASMLPDLLMQVMAAPQEQNGFTA